MGRLAEPECQAGAPKPRHRKVRTTKTRTAARKKLSYLDSRDFDTIEERVDAAEQTLEGHRAALEDPEVVRDAERLQQTLQAIDQAQEAVDTLYARWSELEAKRFRLRCRA